MGAASRQLYAQPSVMTPGAEFTQLFEQHYAAVYRTALRITGNPADAEDVLQTVFLRVLNRSGALSSAELRPAYFRRASANAAVDLLRRRVSRAESQLDDAATSAAAEGQPLLKERLRRAIGSLQHQSAGRSFGIGPAL